LASSTTDAVVVMKLGAFLFLVWQDSGFGEGDAEASGKNDNHKMVFGMGGKKVRNLVSMDRG
jgi:hypothetical protein